MISEDLENFEKPNGVISKRRHRFRALLAVVALLAASIVSITPANADIRVTVEAGDRGALEGAGVVAVPCNYT